MITVKTFVKKPVQIKAVQLTEDNLTDVAAWANAIMPADKQILIDLDRVIRDKDVYCLYIPTKEGEMKCSIGDYLIKEPFPTDDRMFYPCKPDMFILTYDEYGNK